MAKGRRVGYLGVRQIKGLQGGQEGEVAEVVQVGVGEIQPVDEGAPFGWRGVAGEDHVAGLLLDVVRDGWIRLEDRLGGGWLAQAAAFGDQGAEGVLEVGRAGGGELLDVGLGGGEGGRGALDKGGVGREVRGDGIQHEGADDPGRGKEQVGGAADGAVGFLVAEDVLERDRC